MAYLEYRIVVPVGKFQDKNGKDRRKMRQVGEIYVHSDGRKYVALDPFFNFAACERKPGSDKVFLGLEPVGNCDGP